MTIAKTDARKQYAGDDVTTAFAFPFRFFADSDLQVFLLVNATGVETLQTLTTHYSVSNNGDETGGTVTMVTEPATGETLTILRGIPQTQGTDYAANDPFPAKTHEDALDRLTLLVQQLQEELGRSLIAPASDSASVELPLARASSFLAFDASKNPIAAAGTTGTSDIIVSTFMETVLDDTSATEASQTLDLEKGVDVQAWDAQLDTVAGGSAANATAVTNLTGVNSGDVAGLELIETKVLSGASEADFTGFDSSLYGSYEVRLGNVKPATDGADLLLRTSSDGGSSYDSTINDYEYGVGLVSSAGTPSNDGSSSGSSIKLADNVGGAGADNGVNCTIDINNPDLAVITQLHGNGQYEDAGGIGYSFYFGAERTLAEDVDALRILFSSGNLASGTISFYGLRK